MMTQHSPTLEQILNAVAGTLMRDGRPLETIMDATDCERIANSVLQELPALKSHDAMIELEKMTRIFIVVKDDVDKDYNINHDKKNERRMWTAFDNLKTAHASAALALAKGGV